MIFPTSIPVESLSHTLSFLQIEDVLTLTTCNKSSLVSCLPYMRGLRSEFRAQHRERIHDLWGKAPRDYELRSIIKVLFDSLETSRDTEVDLERRTSSDANTLQHECRHTVDFQNLLSALSSLMLGMKTQNTLLRKVLAHNQSKEERCVALHQYMGDVLVLYHLLPSDSDVSPHCKQNMYLQWVYMHALILRRQDMNPLPSLDFPRFRYSIMTLVYREFGPLGPSFRGRDNIRMVDILAPQLLEEEPPDALDTLFEQSRKVHPMTVQPAFCRFVWTEQAFAFQRMYSW